ncbi:hypothetical protein Tco_1134983 [Tanacetum coccineum]
MSPWKVALEGPSTSSLAGLELSLVVVESLWNEMKGARIVVKGGGDLWEYTASKGGDGGAFVCLVAKGGDGEALAKKQDSCVEDVMSRTYTSLTLGAIIETSLLELKIVPLFSSN